MNATNLKAIVAISEFFQYDTAPMEFVEVLNRVASKVDDERDREILQALAKDISKALL